MNIPLDQTAPVGQSPAEQSVGVEAIVSGEFASVSPPTDADFRSTRRCMSCDEEIRIAAVACPHCRNTLTPFQRLAVSQRGSSAAPRLTGEIADESLGTPSNAVSAASTSSVRRAEPTDDAGTKVAIVYRARKVGDVAQREMNRLAEQVPAFKVFAVCYNRNYKHIEDSIPGRMYCYGQSDLEQLAYPQKLAEVDWDNPIGHHDLPVLRFWRDHPEFERYWVIEDDVRFSGDWRDFFTVLEDSTSDLLMTVMESNESHPDWFWWESLTTGLDRVSTGQKVKGFGPLCRLSAACLAAIDNRYRAGWAGHFETTWPCIAVASGLTIEDIGGDGPFVPPSRRHKFYLASAKQWSLFPGTFVFLPHFHDNGDSEFADGVTQRPMLWHPVKHSDK